MRVVLDANAILPTRAHQYDAGLDLYSPVDALIPPRGSYDIDSGVHVEIPVGCVGMIRSKSGLLFKHSITTDGTIDAGYTGSVRVKMLNHTDQYYQVKRGDKITQIVVQPCMLPEIEVVDSLDDTERGANGFGSTDNK